MINSKRWFVQCQVSEEEYDSLRTLGSDLNLRPGDTLRTIIRQRVEKGDFLTKEAPHPTAALAEVMLELVPLVHRMKM
ncbi:hypothetical protein [Rhodobacteraceae bacterium DSL-40]|uniref:hypothetical protein n=1 Tax=Amaricoccus sp. B4 TaxID=3368557 RepID=UPI000DACB20E